MLNTEDRAEEVDVFGSRQVSDATFYVFRLAGGWRTWSHGIDVPGVIECVEDSRRCTDRCQKVHDARSRPRHPHTRYRIGKVRKRHHRFVIYHGFVHGKSRIRTHILGQLFLLFARQISLTISFSRISVGEVVNVVSSSKIA
jgi:hypothetical protein